jgi:hypothetical protein
MLRGALELHMGCYQPVLLLDAVKLHDGQAVLAACRQAGIWASLVPPRLTWLLQPLDTSAFHPFQAALAKAYLRARTSTTDGNNSLSDFIPCACTAIHTTLQGRDWAGAFYVNGFGRQQAQLSSLVVRHLQLGSAVGCMLFRPTMARLRVCFP